MNRRDLPDLKANFTGEGAQGSLKVTVRPGEPRDAEQIHRLVLELAKFEQLEDQVVATARDLERLLFGEAAAGEALLAEVAGEAAGVALFFTTFSSFLGRPGIHLEDLFVLPRFRRLGVATRLMAALGEICAARGCGRLE